jgi:hypothetical protein
MMGTNRAVAIQLELDGRVLRVRTGKSKLQPWLGPRQRQQPGLGVLLRLARSALSLGGRNSMKTW